MRSLSSILDALRSGNTIAYPTEGVWGLGCDPKNNKAIKKLLELKGRSYEKGLIIIGSNFEQFEEYSFAGRYRDKLMSKWPGPHTWLVPAKPNISELLTGLSDKVALRLSNHKTVIHLCEAFGGAIVSTSANKEGMPTLSNSEEISKTFPEIEVFEGELGGQGKPSTIQDAVTDLIIR